jgi:hypothetical protein
MAYDASIRLSATLYHSIRQDACNVNVERLRYGLDGVNISGRESSGDIANLMAVTSPNESAIHIL